MATAKIPGDEVRTPKLRTFDNAGECVKCGSMDFFLVYESAHEYGRPKHVLKAVCQRCGFWWQVLAKDEL